MPLIEALDERQDELGRVLAVVAGQGYGQATEDVAAQVDHGAVERALAEVEPNQVTTVGADAQQDWRLAAGGRTAADFLDQLLGQQVADELAHRRAREPG